MHSKQNLTTILFVMSTFVIENMAKFGDRFEVVLNNLTWATCTECILIRSSQLDCNVLFEGSNCCTDTGWNYWTSFDMHGWESCWKILPNVCCPCVAGFKPFRSWKPSNSIELHLRSPHKSMSCMSNRLMWQIEIWELPLCLPQETAKPDGMTLLSMLFSFTSSTREVWKNIAIPVTQLMVSYFNMERTVKRTISVRIDKRVECLPMIYTHTNQPIHGSVPLLSVNGVLTLKC